MARPRWARDSRGGVARKRGVPGRGQVAARLRAAESVGRQGPKALSRQLLPPCITPSGFLRDSLALTSEAS